MKKSYLIYNFDGSITVTAEQTTALAAYLEEGQVVEIDDSGNCTLVIDIDSVESFITVEIPEV